MVEFTLEKCKTKASYSATLKRQGKLDLTAINKKFEVILETPILLVVKIEGVEVIIHGYGELLFKNCDDIGLMTKIADKIYSAGMNFSPQLAAGYHVKNLRRS